MRLRKPGAINKGQFWPVLGVLYLCAVSFAHKSNTDIIPVTINSFNSRWMMVKCFFSVAFLSFSAIYTTGARIKNAAYKLNQMFPSLNMR